MNERRKLGNRNLCGSRISQRRNEIGMKQTELLRLLTEKGLKFDATMLSKIEGQTRMVSDYELIAIAEALGVSVNWLLESEKSE